MGFSPLTLTLTLTLSLLLTLTLTLTLILTLQALGSSLEMRLSALGRQFNPPAHTTIPVMKAMWDDLKERERAHERTLTLSPALTLTLSPTLTLTLSPALTQSRTRTRT